MRSSGCTRSLHVRRRGAGGDHGVLFEKLQGGAIAEGLMRAHGVVGGLPAAQLGVERGRTSGVKTSLPPVCARLPSGPHRRPLAAQMSRERDLRKRHSGCTRLSNHQPLRDLPGGQSPDTSQLDRRASAQPRWLLRPGTCAEHSEKSSLTTIDPPNIVPTSNSMTRWRWHRR